MLLELAEDSPSNFERLGTSLGPSLAKLLEFTLAEHSAALLLPHGALASECNDGQCP